MKNEELMLYAALAVAGALYMGRAKAKPVLSGATEVFTQGDARGWRYFSDGTAISPDGTYYKNGEMIWNPTM